MLVGESLQSFSQIVYVLHTLRLFPNDNERMMRASVARIKSRNMI